MVGWAPVLERHEPLAPEGPPASSSEPVAPIIRRHARGRGTGGVQTDAWVDSTGRVRQIPGALGTRSAEGWRDAEETPSATAARIAAEAAARFDENRPMPGERVDTDDSELEASDPDAAFRGLPSWLEDESAEETPPREGGERSFSFVRAGASVDVPLDAFSPALPGVDDTGGKIEKSVSETSIDDASDLRGAVGRMRFELEAVGAAREAHLAEVRAFLDLSGRKRLGADTPASPATAARTKVHRGMTKRPPSGSIEARDADGGDDEDDVKPDDDKKRKDKKPSFSARDSRETETETEATRRDSFGVAARGLSEPAASWEGIPEDDPARTLETPPVASTPSVSVGVDDEGMGLALGLPPPREARDDVERVPGELSPASAAGRLSVRERSSPNPSWGDGTTIHAANGASRPNANAARPDPTKASRFADAESRQDRRLKAQWEAFREAKANAEKRDAEAAAILRLAEREARLELDARRAEAAREAKRREADLARERERREQQAKLDARLAAQAAEHAEALEAERRKHEACLDAAARERREALDAEARRAAAAAAADAEVRLAAEAFFEADRRFEEQMVQEREAREARAASFAADAERARRRDSATVLADLRRETERERAPGPSETDPERAPGPPDANGSRDVEDRESATARYIDAATGRVETVAQVAEALAARAVEATLERATLDDRRSASGNENRRTENESPNHGPSLLRLQLRAVATLLDAQRRKHAERLAALHARYLEVDVRREAQDRLLRFAEAEDDVRAARGLARRGRGARRRKWHPPGGGVFLNSGTNASSHNANASYARHSTRDAGLASEEGEPTSLREPLNPADPDPFRGSAFSRSVLVALGNKLLMKAALGVFAAGAPAPRVLRQGVAQECRRAGARGARRAGRRRAARARKRTESRRAPPTRFEFRGAFRIRYAFPKRGSVLRG